MTTVLLEDGQWRFVQHGDDVYRAPLCGPRMPDGSFGGMRFFCPLWQWRDRQESGVYPFEQRELS